MIHSQIAYLAEQLCKKKIFDVMIGLQSEEMTAFWEFFFENIPVN